MLFTPSKIKDINWYNKCLVKAEENKDAFGNKGCFVHNEKFKLCLLFEGQESDYVNFVTHHELKVSQFVVVIIE